MQDQVKQWKHGMTSCNDFVSSITFSIYKKKLGLRGHSKNVVCKNWIWRHCSLRRYSQSLNGSGGVKINKWKSMGKKKRKTNHIISLCVWFQQLHIMILTRCILDLSLPFEVFFSFSLLLQHNSILLVQVKSKQKKCSLLPQIEASHV